MVALLSLVLLLSLSPSSHSGGLEEVEDFRRLQSESHPTLVLMETLFGFLSSLCAGESNSPEG